MVILVMVGGNSVGDVGVDMINVKVTGGGSDKVARVVLVVAPIAVRKVLVVTLRRQC